SWATLAMKSWEIIAKVYLEFLHTLDQKPPMPALMGKNNVPAPMAVPNNPSIQVVSLRFQEAMLSGATSRRSTTPLA
ncbi:hypothetical protein RX881_13100, partial [Pseudomonas syringae pv. actinidiae]|nr:hypothetical protein [Pseudomonas syringae pv. actinidiae]